MYSIEFIETLIREVTNSRLVAKIFLRMFPELQYFHIF